MSLFFFFFVPAVDTTQLIDPRRSWFEFLQDDHDKASFRIYCPASDSLLYSRVSPDPTFDNYDLGLKYDDQLWRFVLAN